MSDALERSTGEFLAYLRDVRQLSPHTLSNYERDLDSLCTFAREQGRTDPAGLARLQRAQDRLRELSSALSHDLPAPMRGAAGYLQLLQRRFGKKLKPEAAELVERALEETLRAHRMIEHALVYARLDANVELVEVDAGEACARALTRLQAEVDATAALHAQRKADHDAKEQGE